MFHVNLIVGQHSAALQRLPETFGLPELPHERHADGVRTRRHSRADLQPGVRAGLHVGFPFRIAGKPGLAVAGVACRSRSALGVAAHSEPFQKRAIETDIELLRPAHAHDVVLVLPAEANLDQVLAVD